MAQKNKWSWKKRHDAMVWNAMKRILDKEIWEDTLSDRRLTDAICNMGVYTTPTITRKVRYLHKIGTSDERRVQLFAKHKR